MNFCMIPKSLSTIIISVACLLYNPQEFLANNRSLNTETHHTRYVFYSSNFHNKDNIFPIHKLIKKYEF